MLKRIFILMLSSFAFNIIFGVILSRKPDLFAKIQNKVSKTNTRNIYKLMFLIIAAILVVALQEIINLDEIVALIILGFSLSLSGIVFRDMSQYK